VAYSLIGLGLRLVNYWHPLGLRSLLLQWQYIGECVCIEIGYTLGKCGRGSWRNVTERFCSHVWQWRYIRLFRSIRFDYWRGV